MTAPQWSTSCTDWEERIVAGRSLVPFDPLFPSEAEAALKIFRNLRIVDAPGRPTMGEACRPWVMDFVATIFGSLDPDAGRRLIRYFFLLIAKKNIKSTLAAGVMVTALVRNFRKSGEFYILAPTKEVADNSFAPARDMVQSDAYLTDILKVESSRTITHRNTGAFLKVVAADSETVSGKKTIGLFVDELWLFGKRANAAGMFREAMGGLASRPEGFVIDASTQGEGPPAGVFKQRLEKFRDIRDGKRADPRSFGLMYEFPKRMIDSGEFKNPDNFYIPNPNLDKSVDKEYLLEQLAEAKNGGMADLIGFYAKHLNVQPGMAMRSDGWAGAIVWARGLDTTLTLKELLDRSEVVVVGIDGGGLDDLLGVAVIGREKSTGRWLGWAHGLISTIGIVRRKANVEDYIRFKRAGELTVFRFGVRDARLEFVADGFSAPESEPMPDGEDDPSLAELLSGVPPAYSDPSLLPPDIQYVVDLVSKIRDRGLLANVGVDAAGIGAIVDALATIGVTQDLENLDAVRQGIALMGAIKSIERKLADGTFLHGDSPLLDWCVGNLMIVPTPTAMRVARDESGFGKVDPVMALFNAGHLMSLNPDAAGLSVFDQIAADATAQTGDKSEPTPAEEASILRDHAHPRWQEMRERFEARLAAQDTEEYV